MWNARDKSTLDEARNYYKACIFKAHNLLAVRAREWVEGLRQRFPYM